MLDLHHFSLSAPCRMIRLSLAEKDVEFTLCDEKIWERNERFLALNPSGDVPVLVVNGNAIAGLYAVTEYIEEAYSQSSLMGKTLGEKAEVRRLIAWFCCKMDHDVTAPLVGQKFMRRLLEKTHPDSKILRLALQNLHIHLQYMTWLLERRKWLAGPALTMADFAAAGALSILDYFGDIAWNDYETIKEWYVRCKSRKAFRGILQDRIPGIPGSLHYQTLDF